MSKRRIITISDESGEAEVKLWGDRLMSVQPAKETQITITCLSVEHYLNRMSVNSKMSTIVEVMKS